MTRDPATSSVRGDFAPAVLIGLEPLGSDVLIQGEIRALSADEIVVSTASMLAAGTRAFVVIEDPGGLAVVGLVEVVDQQVVIDDVTVELRARFVRLSEQNAAHLALLSSSS